MHLPATIALAARDRLGSLSRTGAAAVVAAQRRANRDRHGCAEHGLLERDVRDDLEVLTARWTCWAAGTADANVILPAITLATGEYAVYDQGGWMFFTSLGEQKGKGTIGATGAVGVTGATGAAGVTGVTGATGPAITIANTEAADVTGSGIIRTGTAGENVSFGDVVYMKSDGKLWKADANAAGLFPAMAMALGTITANNSGSFLLRGQARNDAWNWTVGGIVYLSTTAGSMTQTQPAATDDCIQVLGVAFPNADTVNFNPSPDYITHT